MSVPVEWQSVMLLVVVLVFGVLVVLVLLQGRVLLRLIWLFNWRGGIDGVCGKVKRPCGAPPLSRSKGASV